MPKVRELANPLAARRREVARELSSFVGAQAMSRRDFARFYGCDDHAAARMLADVPKIGEGKKSKMLCSDIAAKLVKEM